jgi:hypothetical protein
VRGLSLLPPWGKATRGAEVDALSGPCLDGEPEGASSAMTRGRDLLPCADDAKKGMEHPLQLIFLINTHFTV